MEPVELKTVDSSMKGRCLMRTISIFGRLPGALALGASVCTLSLAAMAGMANAAIITIENVAYSAPQKGQGTATAPLPNSCYVTLTQAEDIADAIDCKLIDPITLAPVQWKAAAVGDLVLLNATGSGTPATPACPVAPAATPDCAPAGVFNIASGCSDLVRFYNDAATPAQAHIFYAGEDYTGAAIPAKQVGTDNCRNENPLPSPATDDAAIASTARQITNLTAGPVRVRIQSNIPGTSEDILLAWY
jgi:hypothetical protein